MTDHDVLPHGGDGRENGRLGAHNDPGRGRRERLPGEEGGSLVLGERVGVEVVAGAGEAGHGVARGGRQAALSQMEPGGGQTSSAQSGHGLGRSVQRVNIEAQVEVSPAGLNHGPAGRGGSDFEQTLLDNPVTQA